MRSFEKSNALIEREKKVAPLAAQTFSKSYRYFMPGAAPMFIDHAEGARVYDVDGNEFIDFICCLGPITLGYNYPAVNKAVMEQLNKGIIFSTQAPVECELAEKLVEVIPCAEMVKFVKNGSDATTAAIRLARAYTGRERVAMCGYHGMHDWSIGASANNKGVPKAVCELTKTFKYNDIASLENLLAAHPGEYAAVIMEPIQSNGTTKEYLQAVIDTAHKHGAVAIFDEVVSGFRYAIGGASEYYGVTPDMASYGKGCANGMSLSFVAGKREIISLIEQGVFVSMTFGGDAISMAGALATIKEMQEKDVMGHAWKLGTMILEGLKERVEKHGVGAAVSVSGLAAHCGVAFDDVGSLNYLDIHSIYAKNMLENGILCQAITNISFSHTEDDVKKFLDAADCAFAEIRKAIDKDSVDGILSEGARVNPVFKRNIK
ncbi:MAG: aminotransferase class III-fold pyridoxal phosphate-dependent enzyme [Clostridia bacterium]|nr:aminotransferase class III-fold pyridoxal phosphate-dependent enzyme [Clostridia bacterium]